MSTTGEYLGERIRELRLALGWRQRTLAVRAGVSQSWVSKVEGGRCAEVSVAAVESLLAAMGARLLVDVSPPFIANSRQRDAVHARCSSHVARRLERAGWQVTTEVEIGGDRSRGWIDILAWHPVSGTLFVIEIKTELRDLGAIERSLGWYEREAWTAARRLGWRPTRVVGCLLLLATEAVELRITDNRPELARSFPTRARELANVVAGQFDGRPLKRGLALIDPRSRRAAWLRPSRVDGRRTPAPYADYADFIQQDSGPGPRR